MAAHGERGSAPPEGADSPPLIDLALGLVFVLGGAGLFYSAQVFQPMIPNTVIGPGLMPSVCAIIFMIFGTALAIVALRKARAGIRVIEAEDTEHGSLFYSSILLGGLVLVVLLIPYLGFVITSSLYAFAVTWAGRASWWGAALSAVAITLLVEFLFSNLMRVPLPTGIVF